MGQGAHGTTPVHSFRSQMKAGVSAVVSAGAGRVKRIMSSAGRGGGRGGTSSGGAVVVGLPEVWALGPKRAASGGSGGGGGGNGIGGASETGGGASGKPLAELVGDENVGKLKTMCGRCVAGVDLNVHYSHEFEIHLYPFIVQNDSRSCTHHAYVFISIPLVTLNPTPNPPFCMHAQGVVPHVDVVRPGARIWPHDGGAHGGHPRHVDQGQRRTGV